MDLYPREQCPSGPSFPVINRRLIDVPPEDVHYVKAQISHWIDEATNESSSSISQDIWDAIENRSAQLWLVWGEKPEAVCVTQLTDTAKGKQCHIWIMVGNGMENWMHLIAELEAWAKREGCTMMRHEARPGWSRILKSQGYTMPHVILEKEL
jgi:hypothetical protein